MDWIKKEIDSKKRALDQISSSVSTSTSSAPVSKYIKRADLEKQRLEERRVEEELDKSEREKKKFKAVEQKKLKKEDPSTVDEANAPDPATTTTTTTDDGALHHHSSETSKPEAFNISNEEAVRRLRAKGQPIRLFGESDKERRLRVRALQLIEERTEGQRNDFMRAMDGMEMGLDLQEMEKNKNKSGGNEKGKKESEGKDAGEEGEGSSKKGDENVLVDMSLVKSNPHNIYPQIYHALKRILKEWEQSLAERPENVKRSTQGKIAAATQQTSAEYLKPLFKSLRKRDLAPDVLQAVAEITYNMQMREYLRANDAYLRLSIGNAPWPIGVTMVGIHERSGREKIFSNNVAHVLNDETSRKYIQSLKRLLTFAQTKYPPDDLSQMMG